MNSVEVKTNNESAKKLGMVYINREQCKGCGFCIEFCPFHVLAPDKEFNQKGYHPPLVVNPGACTGCNLCGLYCPDFAIHGVRIRGKQSRLEGVQSES
jgi:2-oxoglutarate ferredoxin oxidoreductase subunit delta